MLVRCVVFLLLATCSVADAVEIDAPRAKFHYQLHCQGCHTENGRGFGDVPQLKGFVGHFLKIDQGRSYLVQVPGSANAYLKNKDLAQLLNWMLLEFSEGSLPEQWEPFNEEEIHDLRKTPLLEVENYRKALIEQIAAEIGNKTEKDYDVKTN